MNENGGIKMWYFLDCVTGHKSHSKEVMAELDCKNPALYDFFIHNQDSNILDHINLKAKGQKDLKREMMATVDYLQLLSFPTPVFSKRFFDKLGNSLSGSLSFHPCEVYLETGESYEFYLGRILNRLPVVDKEKSGYRVLTDGTKILDEPYIIKEEADETLLIVRDLELATPIVSGVFKNMVEANKLKIGFDDVSNSFW